LAKRAQDQAIRFSTADYRGILRVLDVERFLNTLTPGHRPRQGLRLRPAAGAAELTRPRRHPGGLPTIACRVGAMMTRCMQAADTRRDQPVRSVMTMKHFEFDQLHVQRSELEHEVRTGHLAVIIGAQGPVCLAVPFDELLLKLGVNLSLALKLFDEEVIPLGKAAQLAGMPLAAFMEHLRAQGMPVARPAPGELEEELARFG
jgi:predicted HTH domain antitoxin